MTDEELSQLKKRVEKGTSLKKEIEDLTSKIAEVTRSTHLEVFIHLQNRNDSTRINWVDTEEIRVFLLKLLEEKRTTKQNELTCL